MDYDELVQLVQRLQQRVTDLEEQLSAADDEASENVKFFLVENAQGLVSDQTDTDTVTHDGGSTETVSITIPTVKAFNRLLRVEIAGEVYTIGAYKELP